MDTSAAFNGVCPLTQLGVIRAQGADAANFLHGQLTQDFLLLGESEARLAALCTAKGRMIASFIGFRSGPDTVLLVCSKDILAATLKRLSMYVMRAKARLTDATAEFDLFGLAGSALAASGLPSDAPAWQRQTISSSVSITGGAAETDVASESAQSSARDASPNISVVTLYPADGVSRALWIAPAGSAAPLGEPLTETLWNWSEVRSGIVTLSTPIVEAFVPQMLNYESVGGVNFKKGCYPGQEIVARSQFRGTLKRRTYRVEADQSLAAGQEVFADDDFDQPVGTVAQAAPSPAGGWSALVSMQVSAAEAAQLKVGSAEGASLTVDSLPYPLLEDI